MSSENGDDFLSEVIVFFLRKVFALTFSGADFNLQDGDGVSEYRLHASCGLFGLTFGSFI